MQKSFFSAVQGKFKAEYQGRYLGHIIEAIAEKHSTIVRPILINAPLSQTWQRGSTVLVSTETRYLQQEGIQTDEIRQADLEITTTDRSKRILVEIKVNDHFGDGQLKSYVNWAKQRNRDEDRAVVVLTAYPLDETSRDFIEKNCAFISHMYLSDFVEKLPKSLENSELVGLLKGYLAEKGYSMYQLKDGPDYVAVRSFMVLNFLPHDGGHGKQVSKANIANGPQIFSNLIQNWQLISKRFGKEMGFSGAPTVRYYPEQFVEALPEGVRRPLEKTMLTNRNKSRKQKIWGRYWLSADYKHPEIPTLECGQILQVEHGDTNEKIQCGIYAFFKKNRRQLSNSNVRWLRKGILHRNLYVPEEFILLLREKTNQALTEIKHPAI